MPTGGEAAMPMRECRALWLVLAAVAGAACRDQVRAPDVETGAPAHTQPAEVAAAPKPPPRQTSRVGPAAAPFTGAALDRASDRRTLILYDTGGPYGLWGELYAIAAGNLVSRFGPWTAKPTTTYACGELAGYDATLYIGATYDEPLPTCLLDDVLGTSRPVIWVFYNIWQLSARAGYNAFTAKQGWIATALDLSVVSAVEYKGRLLDRHPDNRSGILGTRITAPRKAKVLAVGRREQGGTLPWAIRSGHLTYVADLPFRYTSEGDRYLAFADLLFDALAPSTPERHRMLLRLEDISPASNPARLREIADYLHEARVPFGFGVVAEFRDPAGALGGGRPSSVRLDEKPELVAAIRYMVERGGVAVMHGYTHQWDGGSNPYTRATGHDTEFFRMREDPDKTIVYEGPLPEDSVAWAADRIERARTGFVRAGLAAPTIFEFPHYAASVNSYRAAAAVFTTRWERALYFPGLLGGEPDHRWMLGQFFPYVVRDVYGSRVLPENLGNVGPEPFHIFPSRLPADIVAAARKHLVVRDGVAGFYFHPFLELDYLRQTVEGVRALGYTFVSPEAL
jgi:uncharacterized protein YdaL